MWYITHASSGETLCFLPEKLKYTVGRSSADLELPEDACISRAHAVFHLIQNKDQLLLVELEDFGSKYGTFYNNDIDNDKPLEKGHKIVLKDNDSIRFGRSQNVWRVHCMNVNTVTSTLSNDDVENVNTYIKPLGGKILEQWSSSCTHLTMKNPSVTMKLLHAVVDQKHVVTPEYWKDLLNAVSRKKSQLPKPELYCPRFSDDAINVCVKPERRFLFKGWTFVFLNRKHFDMYSPIVMAAGGACKDLNSGVQKAFLIKNKVSVIQYTPSTQTQTTETINKIAEFLESHSKRIIPEYEIGLAILHCSIEKFCNPCFIMTKTMPLTASNESADLSMHFDLTNTQESTPSIDTKTTDSEIPETNDYLEVNKNMVTSTPFVELDTNNTKEVETMPNMRITETPAHDNQRKRKLGKVMSVDLDESDDENLFQFQSKKPCPKKDDKKEIKEKSQNDMEQEEDVTPSTSKATTLHNSKEDEETPSTSKAKTTENKIFSNFLEKTQTKSKNKSQLILDQSVDSTSATKENRKRPRIQVLDENDEDGVDDDLFSFGDTPNKKSRADKGKSTADNEDDLFGFKANETQTKSVDVEDEDSNDMIPTQQFLVVEKPAKTMPKPKILPRKLSTIGWLTGSLGKIKIKNENSSLIKDDENIKTESTVTNDDDPNISEDHRKWLDSLQNVIEIQQVCLNNTTKCSVKSHYRFKNRSNANIENLNETTTKNFKTFVKKYASAQNSSVIKLHLR